MKKNGLTDIQAISALSTNQMTTDLFKKFHFQHAQFERDRKLIEDVTSGGDSKEKYNQLLKTDPLLAQEALHAQWSNIQARIGYEILPKLLPPMIKFAGVLASISDWAERHPVKFKFMIAGFVGLSVSLSIIGKVMMAAGIVKLLGLGPMLLNITSILGGPLVWALIAATAAVIYLYKNWDQVRTAAKQMGKDFSWIMSTIWERMKQVGEHIKNWGIWASFNNFYTRLMNGFDDLFNNIISYMNKIPGLNLLNTHQLKVNNQALDLLNDLKIVTGSTQLGNAPKVLLPTNHPKTSSDKLAEAMMMQGKSSNTINMADGLKGINHRSYTPDVPGKQNQPIQVNSTINLDGKPIANVVTKHQSQEAAKPPASTSAFDSTRSLVFPGQVSSLSAN